MTSDLEDVEGLEDKEARAARRGLDAGAITAAEALRRSEQLYQLLVGAAVMAGRRVVTVALEVRGLRMAALGRCDCAGEGKWWLGEHRPVDPRTGRSACPRWTPDPAGLAELLAARPGRPGTAHRAG